MSACGALVLLLCQLSKVDFDVLGLSWRCREVTSKPVQPMMNAD